MVLTWKRLFFGLIVPALAGVVVAGLWVQEGSSAAPAAGKELAAASRVGGIEEDLPPLPDDDANALKDAAMAGRTENAKRKVKDLLAAGAVRNDIAGYLAAILVAEPGYLEAFLREMAPGLKNAQMGGEERERWEMLIFSTVEEVGRLQPDAQWILARNSPMALKALKDVDCPTGEQVESTAGFEAILDPVLGFSDADIGQYFFQSHLDGWQCRRLLEMWGAGRWRGDSESDHENMERWMENLWDRLGALDSAGREDLKQALPPELATRADLFSNRARIMKSGNPLTPDDLQALTAEQRDQVIARGVWDSSVSLKTLEKLPDDIRLAAFEARSAYLFNQRPDRAIGEVEHLDQSGLPENDRQRILTRAITWEWQSSQRDLDIVLRWTARLSDEEERTKTMGWILTQAATSDPQRVLEMAKTLPESDLRNEIVKTATEALK